MYSRPEMEIALKILREIKEESSQNDRYGFDDDWEFFIMKMQFLSPKSFGTRIQNRIIEKNKFPKTNPSKDLGDFEIDGKCYEFKTTILTPSNKLANFVNIRRYQNIDGYLCLVIDTNRIPYETSQFKLTKDQMDNELERLNANPSNGTQTANQVNKNISYRFSINLSQHNEHSKRWNNYYQIDSLLL